MVGFWIALSGLLHAFLIAGAYLCLRKAPAPHRTSDSLRLIEIAPPSPVVMKAQPLKKQGQVAGRIGDGGRLSHLQMSDLALPVPFGAGALTGGPSGLAYGSGGDGLLEKMQGTVVYEELHSRINQAFHYPHEFIEAGIEGTGKALLIFSEDGKWESAQSPISATSAYLRVLIAKVLRSAFTEPLPKPYRRQGQRLKLICVFELDLSRKDDPIRTTPDSLNRITSQSSAIGNRLSFYRAAKSMGQWKLGPLSGYGIAPSIGVDPGWFVEQVQDLVDKKAKADPLQKYRDDPAWIR